ncbi:MAG: hypothetical protein NTW31_07280 [Bacteroidetes bacterium]|nr:hypothetical protein [Bacteroidota bacterium]
MTQYQAEQQKPVLHWLLIAIILATACVREKPVEKRILFPGKSWQRYHILKYEFPISEMGKSYDVIFELRLAKTFAYDELPLNMVLNTPSGEERIREYQLQVKSKNGSFTGTLSGDTCITRLVLKRNLYCSGKGILKVEIENLYPRMETEGIYMASLFLIQR